jgi:hypothetical protein
MSANLRTNANRREALPMELYTVELGNSDRIRLKFGSYGIEVLESGDRIRVSNLYSIEDGVTTVRTFAVVALPAVIEPDFKKEHEQITEGQSIGIVFKDNGWVIDKRHQFFGNIEIPFEIGGIRSVFADRGTAAPAIHVYSLFISKQGREFHYASIAEIHHPDYLTLDDLKVIYGEECHGNPVPDEWVGEFLQIVKTKMATV